MFDTLQDFKQGLRGLVSELDPEVLDGQTASRLTSEFAELERLAAAGKALCAGRVASCGAWRSSGEKSPARWMARQTGTSVGRALSVLETAQSLRELPEVDQALRSGQVSEPQATEIAPAASASPRSQSELLEAAKSDSLQELKQRCARVRAAAAADETERYARIHSQRRLRYWTDAEGAFRLDGSMTPDAGATVLSALEPYLEDLSRQARQQDRHDSREALLADALVAVAEHTRGCEDSAEQVGPAPAVRVLVDQAVLEQAKVLEGQTCEIDGAGPVPASVATGIMADSNLAAILMDGKDVTGISHLGRTINARLRTALQIRDPRCVVPGCYISHKLQIDHIRPVKLGGPTELANLARLCTWHHRQKTHHGYRLSGGPGRWIWEPPAGKSPLPQSEPTRSASGSPPQKPPSRAREPVQPLALPGL
ncbi:MAG: DUF222 domain-containing protein [Actinomycetota bacterium]